MRFFTVVLVFMTTSNMILAQEEKFKGSDNGKSEAINLLQLPGMAQGLVPGFYPLSILVDNPRVIDELELTETQKTKMERAKKIQSENMKKYNESVQDRLRTINEKMKVKIEEKDIEERDFIEANAKTDVAAMNIKNDDEVLKLLDQQQKKRLREIRLQAEGPKSFQRDEVRESLALTPEQINQIQMVIIRVLDSLRKAATLPEGVRIPKKDAKQGKKTEAYTEAKNLAQSSMANVRVQTMKSIEQLLTNGQRSAYKRMVGETFDFLSKVKDKKEKTNIKGEAAK